MTRSNTTAGPDSMITAVGTYLPPWGAARRRTPGLDEDAVTLCVAAGLAALRSVDPADVGRVVMVSRDLPLIEGSNSAAVLAGLGLRADTEICEVIGGAPAVLDALTGAAPGTLVIGADTSPAGAAAAYCGTSGAALTASGRITRSMPVVTRDAFGRRADYADPRLVRVRGLGASLDQLDRSVPIAAAAGLAGRDAKSVCATEPCDLPTEGPSAALFALATLAELGQPAGQMQRLLAVEQATLGLADLGPGEINVQRDERAPRPVPSGTTAPGSEMSISLAAYERAFDAKLRLVAARCRRCGTLAYPHRYRCLGCGSEDPTDAVALPRDAEIYTLSTIHVPVPGLVSPYTIVVAELGDSGVRVTVRLTGAAPGSVGIGDRGRLVFRLVAVRSGVPDYGYAFLPDDDTEVTA